MPPYAVLARCVAIAFQLETSALGAWGKLNTPERNLHDLTLLCLLGALLFLIAEGPAAAVSDVCMICRLEVDRHLKRPYHWVYRRGRLRPATVVAIVGAM
jgi:hypothetical protein